MVRPVTVTVEAILLQQIGTYAAYYVGHVILIGMTYLWKKMQQASETRNRKLYKEVRILERVINASLRGRLMPSMIFGISLIQYYAGSVVLAMSGKMESMEWYFLVASYAEAVIFIPTVLTIAGQVFVRSRKLQSWQRSKLDKAHKKEVRSWRPFRIEFGQNFVDPLTPLVIQSNVTRETITFVVVYRNK